MSQGESRERRHGVRLTDRISLGTLADVSPRDLIEEVLNVTGRREQRTRLLPAHVVVRFCQAMCLFYEDDYEEVVKKRWARCRTWDPGLIPGMLHRLRRSLRLASVWVPRHFVNYLSESRRQ